MFYEFRYRYIDLEVVIYNSSYDSIRNKTESVKQLFSKRK